MRFPGRETGGATTKNEEYQKGSGSAPARDCVRTKRSDGHCGKLVNGICSGPDDKGPATSESRKVGIVPGEDGEVLPNERWENQRSVTIKRLTKTVHWRRTMTSNIDSRAFVGSIRRRAAVGTKAEGHLFHTGGAAKFSNDVSSPFWEQHLQVRWANVSAKAGERHSGRRVERRINRDCGAMFPGSEKTVGAERAKVLRTNLKRNCDVQLRNARVVDGHLADFVRRQSRARNMARVYTER